MSDPDGSTPELLHDGEIARYGFEHARDILLVICATTGRIVDANRAAVAEYQYTRDELLAHTIFEIRAADPEPVPAQMKQARAHGILFESVHQRRDGSTFPVEVSSRGHEIGGRPMLLSVVRDISERRRTEAERELMIETTRRALALRDDFLAIASHELRSPVTNVSLKLQHGLRLLERAGVAPAVSAATREALDETTRLAALITTLLDARVVESGISLSLAPTDLARVVRNVAVQLREHAVLAGSALHVEVPPVSGMWDPMRLEQVFANILSNAIKYGRGRDVHVIGTSSTAHAIVEIRDEGLGIANEDTARVFEKFARAVPPAYGGFGLGLYISRQLVEAHNGRITVDSRPGQGTTFRVELPITSC